LIEAIKEAFIFHEGCSAQIIEAFWGLTNYFSVECFQKCQVFFETGGYSCSAEFIDEI